jgi:membrane protease YdiL (CAAX protease family)
MMPILRDAQAWESAINSLDVWVFTVFLVIVFPVLDWLFYARATSRLAIYTWNIFAEWSLVAGCIFVFWPKGLRPAGLGEQLGNALLTFSALGVLMAIFATAALRSWRQIRRANEEEVSKAVGNLRRMLPMNREQRAVYILMALTAGVCEEFLYRGCLLNVFGAALGSLWLGLLVSSIAFAFAHAYQGRDGVIGSGGLGLVFGLVFLIIRSVFPLQVVHALINVVNGITLGNAVSRLEDRQSRK